MLQVKGTYDDTVPVLKRIFTEGVNGTLLPIKNYGQFVEKGGLDGTVDVIDLTPIAKALDIAIVAFGQLLQQIYGNELKGFVENRSGRTVKAEK